MAKDYHRILGVSKDADEKEIRKAYRKLALLFHPDRNKEQGAEERFKEISEAYAILSGKEKEPQPIETRSARHGTTGPRHRAMSEYETWALGVLRRWQEMDGQTHNNMYR